MKFIRLHRKGGLGSQAGLVGSQSGAWQEASGSGLEQRAPNGNGPGAGPALALGPRDLLEVLAWLWQCTRKADPGHIRTLS